MKLFAGVVVDGVFDSAHCRFQQEQQAGQSGGQVHDGRNSAWLWRIGEIETSFVGWLNVSILESLLLSAMEKWHDDRVKDLAR